MDHESRATPQTPYRTQAIEIGKLVTPFLLGLATLWYFLSRIDTGSESDLRVIFFGVTPAYKLATVAYAIFGASIVVVLIGTGIYLLDIRKLSRDITGAGDYYVTSAFLLALITIILIPIGLFYWMAYTNVASTDVCSGHDVMLNFYRHDEFVLMIFSCFLVLDLLTSVGLSRAINALENDDDRKERLCDFQRWARAQLLLVDVPVLAGAFILLFAMPALAEGPWRVLDHQLINGPIFGDEFSSGASRLTSLDCNTGAPFPIHEFIGNMYVAGVGTGALAAQIFLSQMVFVMLGFFFRLKRANAY